MSNTTKKKLKVAIIGSGNWGSAIAKIIGTNVTKFAHFDREVKMHVHEEIVNGRKLSEIINSEHENVKYLPKHKLPNTVIADPDVLSSSRNADILVFVIPHAFVASTCAPLKGKVKSTAIGISLIKGFGETPGSGIQLISELIKSILKIEVSVLMGANIASEVAEEKFCETTIGCKNKEMGKILKDLFQTDHFRITVVPDTHTVEICGALKNIVACAAGFADGLGLGDNTKAAVIRIGLKEMIRFCKTFFPQGLQISTFFESCGVADLITTCFGGRNTKVSKAFVETGKSLEVLEKEMLNGQKLQGYQTANEVVAMLKSKGCEKRFPLFVCVQQICNKLIAPNKLIDYLRLEPDD